MSYLIGEQAKLSKQMCEEDVNRFADISGDYNPLHVNRDIAQKSVFGRKIVHGMLVGSLLSAVIGMELPGPGTIYLEQSLKFLNPTFIGDTLTAIVEIVSILNENKGILKLKTQIINQNDELVVDGYAIVKAPKNGEIRNESN